MKRLGLLFTMVFAFGFSSLNAQQLPQQTQFMFSDFTINPAVTGTKEYYQAISTNRYQWVGIVDAPRTYVLSVYGPHKGKSMGFGGYIYNDVTGPTSRTGLNASYGYQFKITEDIKISLGLSAGLLQYKVDATKITFREEDLAVGNVLYTDYLPDANAGVYVYSDKWFGGFSANQLLFFYNKVKLMGERNTSDTRIKTHIFAMGGYKLSINDDIMLEPSLYVKYVGPVPPQFDLNVKAVYKQDMWAGISYRHADAIAVMIGYQLMDQIFFGYAYDFGTTELRKHSSGTHELMIGAKFNKLKEDEADLSM